MEDFNKPEFNVVEKSPIREAYLLLDAKNPLELHTLYIEEDQRLMKSHEWDYKNESLIINRVKNIIEEVSPESLSEDERVWRSEILWSWYHHAISTAIALYKDIELATIFARKALQYQSEDHPNKITRLFLLLLENKLEEAEKWARTIDLDSVEVETAQDLIENYKLGGALNIVS